MTITLRDHSDNSRDQRYGIVAMDSFVTSTYKVYLAKPSWPFSVGIDRNMVIEKNFLSVHRRFSFALSFLLGP